MLFGFLVGVFSFVVVGFISYMIYKNFEVRFEIEASDFIAKARAIEVDRKNSCIVFSPKDSSQTRFFIKLEKKGIVRKNPLSTGGYILTDSYRQIWKEFANFTPEDIVHVKEVTNANP